VGDRLFWIEVEPALTALALGPTVPGHAQGLKAPTRKFNQVLLERIEAKHIRDLVIAEFAIGSVRAREEFSIAPEEAGCHAEVRVLGAIEISEHAGLVGGLHREVVMRALPEVERSGVARLADFATHKAGRRSWRFRHTPIRLRAITASGEHRDCRNCAKPHASVQQISSASPMHASEGSLDRREPEAGRSSAKEV